MFARLLVCVGLVTFFGCSNTKYQYVVLRDVPQSPTFVVIPPNRYMYEIEFANTVEEIIMSLGVRVVDRPATKEVTETTEKGVAGAKADDSKLMAGERSHQLVESYFAYEDLKADYIVRSYSNSKQVRIIKRQSEEILASINLSHYPTPIGDIEKRDSYRYIIFFFLDNMGISVIQPPNPMQVKSF